MCIAATPWGPSGHPHLGAPWLLGPKSQLVTILCAYGSVLHILLLLIPPPCWSPEGGDLLHRAMPSSTCTCPNPSCPVRQNEMCPRAGSFPFRSRTFAQKSSPLGDLLRSWNELEPVSPRALHATSMSLLPRAEGWASITSPLCTSLKGKRQDKNETRTLVSRVTDSSHPGGWSKVQLLLGVVRQSAVARFGVKGMRFCVI